jgi:hypothetical protein
MISFTLGQAAPALTTIENVACLPGKILNQCDMLQKLATHPASKDRINKPTSTAPVLGYVTEQDFKRWVRPADMSIPTKHKKLFQSRQGCFSA